jgi:uncharacterized tellurite resistance protein B-like protein
MANFAITQDDMKDLGEDQKSTIFDALVAAAWADGNVSQAEMARFEQEVVKIPWGKDEADLIKMVHASKDRVAALKDKDAVMAFIKAISEKLPNQDLREKLLYTMGLIMFTDRELNNAEKNVIVAFTEAFGISKERFEAIGMELFEY